MRSIKKNFALQTVYQVLGIITPLITAPYLTRVLGAEKLGIYSYTESIASYFVLFAMLGLTTYGQRAVARVRNDKSKLAKVFSEVFLVHAIVSIFCIVGYIMYCICFNRQYFIYNIIWVFYVISAFLDVNWFFYGIEEFKLTVTRNTIIKIVTVLSIFLFVKTRDDLIYYVAIHSLSFFISQVCLWSRLLKTVSFVKVSFKDSCIHIKPMILLFMAVIATSIYRMMDKVMLGNASFTTQLGCYDYADRIIRIPVSLITALGTVMLPRMTSIYAKKDYESANKYLSYSSEFTFFMCTALAVGLCAISDEFVIVMFGEEFLLSGQLIRILSISIIFMGWNNMIRSQYLVPLSKDKLYVTAVWAGAVVNVFFNFVLIRLYGAVGAATATVIAYITVGFFQTIPICKDVQVLTYLSKLIAPLFNGVIMFVSVRIVSNFVPVSVIGLSIEIGVGAVIFIALSFIYFRKTDNVFVQDMITKIRKKKR